ncbi:MAG: hypothetical protein O2905_04195 [Proteobacteria bacterium]|nr:hypothetical protein [Pseudomonadota bacterium]
MRKLIIIAVGLVVLLGGGLAATIYVIGNFETLASGEEVIELHPGQVAMENLTIPVVSERALDHYVSIDLRFELHDETQIGAFVAMEAYIRDAVLREVHRVVPMREDGIASLDIVWLKQRARDIANEQLAGDFVGRVLVTKIVRVVA